MTDEKYVITIDLDADGEVIGIELVGVNEFSIRPLLKMAGVTAPEEMVERASYVPADLQVA